MHIESYREHCLQKKGVTEHFPFDDNVLVFKVMNKMFALSGLDSWEQQEPKVNLKCNPEWAIELREEYEGVNPGFHMNKQHWNTVTLNNDISDKFAFELIDHSYDLIVKSLTKKLQEELKSM